MDKVTFRILLISLALFEVLLIVGAIFLLQQKIDVPEWMSVAMGSIVTGMLGLAVHQSPPEPVQVTNVPGETVAVDTEPA